MYFALLFLTLLYTILVNLIDQNKAFNRFIPVILFFLFVERSWYSKKNDETRRHPRLE